MKLKPSRYNHICDIDGQYWGFSGRTGALVRFNRQTVDLIATAEGAPIAAAEQTAELVRAGFLVPSSSDEPLTLQHIAYASRYASHVLELVIAPTMDCNMKCRYCFEQSVAPEYITDEVFSGVESLVQSCQDRFKTLSIVWYGGEPLLALEQIKQMTGRLQELAAAARADYSAMIVTNGTLLTAETARELGDLGVSRAQVTLDGMKENHDQNRVLQCGEGTWEQIVNNVGAAAPFLKILIRATLSPDSVGQIYGLCQELDDRGLPQEIPVLPAPLNPDKQCGDLSCQTQPDFNRRLYEEVLSQGFVPQRLQLLYPELAPSCLATRSQAFLIDARGDIHRCLETAGDPEQAVGSVLTAPMQDHRLEKWLQTDPFSSGSTCRECRLLPLCFGGCPQFAVVTGSRNCSRMKGNIEIWMRVQALLHQQRCLDRA